MPFTLYVGQNPEDFLGVTVYGNSTCAWSRVDSGRSGTRRLPNSARLPDGSAPIPGQTTVTFLMDVWVPPDTVVRRSKLEPEVFGRRPLDHLPDGGARFVSRRPEIKAPLPSGGR